MGHWDWWDLAGFASRSIVPFKYKTLAAEQDRADSNGFRTDSIEYASDPRFNIQGGREQFALHLESWIRGVFN